MVEEAGVGISLELADYVPVAGSVEIGAPGEVLPLYVYCIQDNLDSLVLDYSHIMLDGTFGYYGRYPSAVDHVMGAAVVVVKVH